MLTFPEHFNSPLVFIGVHVTRSLVLFVLFCRSLFVLLYFFFWPLCYLFFFDIRPNTEWYTEDLRNAKRMCRKAERRMRKSNLTVDRQNFKKLCNKTNELRDRPFNLQGGLWFFVSSKNFFSNNTRVRIFIFFVAQRVNFFSRI